MNLDLHGKHAVVCGSSQGIGKAAAISLAQCGANITLLSRNTDSLNLVKSELHQEGDQSHHVATADFTDPESVRNVAQKIASASPVHILVNNTGGPPSGPLLDADVQALINGFSQHVVCNHHLMQAFVPSMKAANYGRIINIISTSVKQPIPNLGVSNTIRGAVASWAKTLATELGGFGITVNNVLPGFTDTVRLSSLFEANAKRQSTTPDVIKANALATIPAKRLGLASELGDAVAFLASPAAGYINGINLPVDGGRLGTL
ncbi:MAG: SDR family oxidoreductase [Phycisphaeraceae bacterium]|nr:SDR family oxidoreductase [Phycisphaerales bacterium]MCB9861402.1 SDR family oxidoreductase [Phycisphaeraceae bacterium]